MLGTILTRTTGADAASDPVAVIEYKGSQTSRSNYNEAVFSLAYDTLSLSVGDVVVVAVICDYTADTINRSTGHPGGTTAYNDATGSRPRLRVDVIKYEASWPSTLDYETSAGDSEDWVGFVTKWANVDVDDPIDDFDGEFATTANPSSTALTATEDNLVAVAVYGAQEDDIDATGTPSSYTKIAIEYSNLWSGASSGGIAYLGDQDIGAVGAAAWTQSASTAAQSAHLLLRPSETGSATISAGMSGTTTPNIGAEDIVTGGKTVVLTLTNDTWIAAGTGPIGSTANTQAIIDGVDSAQAEAAGWDAEVKANLVPATHVVRTNDTICTITLPASASYAITADEVITATIPAAVLTTSGSPVVASPTFGIEYDQFTGSDINWLSPPVLPAHTGGDTYTSQSNITIDSKTIDSAPGNALTFEGCTNVTISNCLISNAGGIGIYAHNCTNFTIRNCKIVNTVNQGVWYYQGNDDLLIEGNWFEDNQSGVEVQDCDYINNYIIQGNYIKNPQGPFPKGLAINLTYCSKVTNVIIRENTCYAVPADSSVEDWINMYRSYGTAATPILISNNNIYGSGTSGSGGGIMSGDAGNSNEGPTGLGYITVDSNTLIDPGQYGIAISGGRDIVVTNNNVFSSKNNANIAISNVGFYLLRIGNDSKPGTMHSCTVSGNNVLWYDSLTTTEGSYFPKDEGLDGLSPNHGTTVEGNVDPTGWTTPGNDFSHSAWDADSGNQGYTDLAFTTTWTYYTPP